jgi:hypothetical protein
MTALLDWLPWLRQGGLPAAGQLLTAPDGHLDWVYFALATGAAGSDGSDGSDTAIDETVWLHYRGGVDQEYLRSLAAQAPFGPGSVVARVGVPRRDRLVALRLPNRPDLRVLAIAYLPTGSGTATGGNG